MSGRSSESGLGRNAAPAGLGQHAADLRELLLTVVQVLRHGRQRLLSVQELEERVLDVQLDRSKAMPTNFLKANAERPTSVSGTPISISLRISGGS